MEKIKFTKKNTERIKRRIKDFYQRFSSESFLLSRNLHYSQVKKAPCRYTFKLREGIVESFKNSYTGKMIIRTETSPGSETGSIFIQGDIFYFGDHTMIVRRIESIDKMPVSGRKKGQLPAISKHFFS